MIKQQTTKLKITVMIQKQLMNKMKLLLRIVMSRMMMGLNKSLFFWGIFWVSIFCLEKFSVVELAMTQLGMIWLRISRSLVLLRKLKLNTIGWYFFVKLFKRNWNGSGTLFPVFWSNQEREFTVKVPPGQHSEPGPGFFKIPNSNLNVFFDSRTWR